ncbi:hypothetical protein Clacol_006218 [Clathrus columnatus]|uniref:Type I restriction enzyme R protein N-terminal domain-containing protein n=1 Tax=Clathrus columnatus TaxID=1419009 RepID=A0AAV5AJ49_9AGAM|nr:hypothetical protein Clacol_006218 [Clathrus columnatus]
MTTLDTLPVLPPPLLHEPPPSVDQLRAQIEHWIIYHLLKTLESNVYYENHLYGPLNSFLASIFPMRRRYMVIPQAILRRALTEDEIGRHHPNVSVGSTGAIHEARDIDMSGGVEHSKHYPDFVIVKVTPRLETRRDHCIVCIVEVKRDAGSISLAIAQMDAYMKQAARLSSRVENLRGYLTLGSSVLRFWLENEEGDLVVNHTREEDMFNMSDQGDPFTRELCQIAIDSWNYQN